MIRMSRLADYSFIILGRMMEPQGASWSAAELAERTALPLPTVAKLLKLLARAEILTAQRGAAGGYRLLRPVQAVTVAHVIEAVDGPIAITDCVHEDKPECALPSFCPLNGGWMKVNWAIHKALHSVTLADMVFAIPPVVPQRRPSQAALRGSA